jgi:hypothetical protein
MASLLVIPALAIWLGSASEGVGVAKAESVAATTEASALNTITVGASGSVSVNPDIAHINVAVETRGPTAGEAQQANATKFAALEKVLYEQYKIDKKDVKTTGFSVYAEYNYTEKEGRVLTGYAAVHSLQVNYRKLDEIGKLVDALTAAGANRIDGIQFATEKSEQYELEALKKAMDNAKAKADTLAAAAGRQVKGVLNIVQGNVTSPPVFAQNAAKVMLESAAGFSTSVQAGQIVIEVSVTVQYQM